MNINNIIDNDKSNHGQGAPRTLPELLISAPAATAIIYVDAEGGERTETYGSLLREARCLLSGLRQQGLEPGAKVVLQLERNDEILPAFWACLLGGYEPVILPVPPAYDLECRPIEQLRHIFDLFDHPLILITHASLEGARRALPAPVRLAAIEELRGNPPNAELHTAFPDDVAFYSLSSGSTGLPKAIALTHRNLLARARGANHFCGYSASDVVLNWLPFDHIGSISESHIRGIELGCKLVYAPKEYVLARPIRWLELIHRYRVTHNWAPNFAYSLVSAAVKSQPPTDLDLSCMRMFLIAGESVTPGTVREFAERLAPYGLAPSALQTAFGMAEVCSGVNYHQPHAQHTPHFFHVDRNSLGGPIRMVASDDESCVSFAALGPIIPGMSMRIVDDEGQMLPEFTTGRFHLKGVALTPGYYRNPEANRVFVDDGWFDTGDSGFIAHGELVIIGRSDAGIIINGANFYNSEIEATVEQVAGVEPSFTAACAVRFGSNAPRLAVFFHAAGLNEADDVLLPKLLKAIQSQLTKRLGIKADFLIPVAREVLPKTEIGKIQRKKLTEQFQRGDFREILEHVDVLVGNERDRFIKSQTPLSEVETQIVNIWREVLAISEVGIHDSFFELGGHSLLLMQVLDRLTQIFGPKLTLVDLFKYPTIHALVEVLGDDGPRATAAQKGQERAEIRNRIKGTATARDIAVIGMACRFPGADDPETFWRNLVAGVESITFFNEAEMIASGIDPTSARHPDYVKAKPILSDVEGFDAEFFGYTTRDAKMMDPQQRLFLEVCWETFENAGYDPTVYPGVVGIYGGASMNTYLFNNVLPNRDTLDTQDNLEVATLDSMGGFQLMVANDKDYLTTRVSYKLNLRGTSVNVQTACSTGLVAIHMACQSLLTGEADMFLAGGSAVHVPQKVGHLYQNGMIVSPDGHCRAFDADAKGTIFGSGVGVVLLKRLDDAINDGDHIYAVIKGSAVNNDGGVKVGYMAPSGDGEAAVAAEALAIAGVSAESIGFVEAHGTGTELGDPIEVNSLTQTFRAHTDKKGFCAIGSVKTNVGHLQIASGSVGFIKAALVLHHKIIPPLLHFKKPNPGIDFDNSPFYVNTQAVDWQATEKTPRRAGVNSLGIGGTNCHVILEEAPPVAPAVNERERTRHLLTLSALTDQALRELAGRYAAYLGNHPEVSLADLCFTANTGRKHFEHRLAVVAESATQLRNDLATVAAGQNTDRVALGQWNGQNHPRIAFLFTGQGSQYVGMGRELYDTQPTFRRALDRCDAILRGHLERPLLDVLYPKSGESPLDQTEYTQPALFALEYALAELWQSFGIQPDIMLGHSVGEYAAACVAGVFSLEDGLKLIAARGRLMQNLPRDGAMVAVMADERRVAAAIRPYQTEVAVATLNGPDNVVISGRRTAVETVAAALTADGIKTTALNVSHAFHSPLMDSMLDDFRLVAASINYSVPQRRLVSNLTGQLVTDEVATPDYWVRHAREAVRFAEGMKILQEQGVNLFVEIGPKPTLLGMGRACLEADGAVWLPSLRPKYSDWQILLESLGESQVRGVPIDWVGFDRDYHRRRLPIPTYPWQHRRYWMDAPAAKPARVLIQPRETLRPLIDRRTDLPLRGEIVFETDFSIDHLPFLKDHRVFGAVLSPAACHFAMTLNGAELASGAPLGQLDDVVLPSPLTLAEGETRTVQLVLGAPTSDRGREFQVISFVAGKNSELQRHATGRIAAIESALTPTPLPQGERLFQSVDLGELQQRCGESLFIDALYPHAIDFGPHFRWLAGLWRGTSEVLGRLARPTVVESLTGYAIHPGLLDACFQIAIITRDEADLDAILLPFAIERIRIHQTVEGNTWWCHVQRVAERSFDIRLLDETGKVLVEISGFTPRPAALESFLRAEPWRDWLYTVEWQARPALGLSPDLAFEGRSWLLLGDATGMSEALAEKLRRRGERSILVRPGDGYLQIDVNHFQIGIDSLEDYRQLLAALPELYGIVHLWSLDNPTPHEAEDLLAAVKRGCGTLLLLTQALLAGAGPKLPILWLVTHAAQSVGDGDAVAGVAHATLWGMGRTLALEHPELRTICIDLDDTAALATEALATEITAVVQAKGQAEGQVALRQGRRYVARLTRGGDHRRENIAPVIHFDASYLITGGLGGLGLRVAQWLVEQGARHLVLLGRRPPQPELLRQLDDWEKLGVTVTVVSADVADRAEMTRAMAYIKDAHPLRGVVHAAGVLEDAALLQQDWPRFAKALLPKVLGAWHLHKFTHGLPLDFFVLFSSVAGLLGNRGQANYAAANAFLDSFAGYRRSRGLAALSIDWGAWSEIGMTAERIRRDDGKRLAEQGHGIITPDQGIPAFAHVLGRPEVQIGVMPVNWAKFAEHSAVFNPFLADLPSSPAPLPKGEERKPPVSGAALPVSWRERLKAAPPAALPERMLAYVREQVVQILGSAPTEPLNVDQSLNQLGFDSLMSIDLRGRVTRDLTTTLPVGAFLDTSIAKLSAQLTAALSMEKKDPQDATGIAKVPARGRYSPLSFIQEDVWLRSQSPELHGLYNLLLRIRLDGNLDMTALRQSLNALVERHEILRTTFPLVDGTPMQSLDAATECNLSVVDLRALDESARLREIERQIATEELYPFDVTRGPLFRVILLHLSENSYLFMVSTHHILMDAGSINNLLFTEWLAFYRGFISSEDVRLPPMSIQYADFAHWQRRTFTPEVLSVHQGYWEQLLSNAPLPLNLPTNRPRPAEQGEQTYLANSEHFSFPPELTPRLKNLARRYDATFYMVLLASYAALLHRYSGREDIVIAAPTSKRTFPELDPLIGHFTGRSWLRIDLSGRPSFMELLARTKRTTLAALENQYLTLRQWLRVMDGHIDWRPKHVLNAEATFNLLSPAWPGAKLPDLTIAGIFVEYRAIHTDVALNLWEAEQPDGTGTALQGFLNYRQDLFDAATIREMVADYRQLLEAVAADPARSIDDLPIG